MMYCPKCIEKVPKMKIETLSSVQKLYHLGHARWYDLFRKFWTRIVERKLEKDFLDALEKNVISQTKIVEIGCGTGINVERLFSLQKTFRSYLGIDFSPDMLAIAQQNFGNEKKIMFIEGDARTVSLPKRYDLVLSTWVLSHIPESSAVINRFYKNLSSNGSMLLVFLTKPHWSVSFWFSPFMRLYHSQYVSEQEIEKMKGMKIRKSYCAGLATFVVIKKN